MPIISRNPKLRYAEKAREDTTDVVLHQGELIAHTLPVRVDRVYGSVKEVVDDDTDVYSMSLFPTGFHGRTLVKFTPRELYDTIEDYAVSPEPIARICAKHGVSASGLYTMARRYTQVREHYERAQKQRADVLVDATHEIALDDSNDIIEGAKGPIINNAAVKRAELRIKSMQWQAERTSVKYMDKRGLDIKQVAVNTNINLPAPKDLQSFDVNDLASIFGK